jgi:hypothetical protein
MPSCLKPKFLIFTNNFLTEKFLILNKIIYSFKKIDFLKKYKLSKVFALSSKKILGSWCPNLSSLNHHFPYFNSAFGSFAFITTRQGLNL